MDDQRRRPPPIQIPPVPAIPKVVASREQRQQQQRSNHNASVSTQQNQRSATTPLASPMEQNSERLSRTASERSNNPETPRETLDSLMQQTGIKQRHSGRASATSSAPGSTTRSRHSQHSHNSNVVARGSEATSRGRIESRREKTSLKAKGPSPSVNQDGPANGDEVRIEVHDLRSECRGASGERKTNPGEPPKSPKKKFMGMTFPALGMSTSKKGSSKPAMPSKFAQVVGEEPRTVRHIPVRPIKPSGAFTTPTKVPRSNSVLLPAKVMDQDRHTHQKYNTTGRRHGTTKKKTPSRPNSVSSIGDIAPPVRAINPSFESMSPPTPPAKDTPPEKKEPVPPGSPLRRIMPFESLRSKFEQPLAVGALKAVPTLEPTPKLSVGQKVKNKKLSSKYDAYDAEYYKSLLTQLPQPFEMPQPQQEPCKVAALHQSPSVASERADVLVLSRPVSSYQDNRSPCTTGDLHKPMHKPHLGRWSDDGIRAGSYHGTLQPRFYSPSILSVEPFEDGETPSKNTNPKRYLCTMRAEESSLSRGALSNDKINIIFQGNAKDIDPNSSTGKLIQDVGAESTTMATNDNIIDALQQVNLGAKQCSSPIQQQEMRPRPNGVQGLVQHDQSSSRLTDLLHGISPLRPGPDGFHCPSAVPSPLHNMPTPPMQAPPIMTPTSSTGLWRVPFGPKPVDHHFFMLNEHLDVVGKTTWDAIEALKAHQNLASNDRSKQLQLALEKRIDDIKMQLEPVTEKADRTFEQAHTIQTKLDEFFGYVQEDVMKTVLSQEQKVAGIEKGIKDLTELVQGMQKTLEQTMSEVKKNELQNGASLAQTMDTAATSFAVPDHRSQLSLAGYYGTVADSGRDGQPDYRNNTTMDVHSDPRAGYGGGYGKNWGQRSGYHNRGSKEDRSYPGANHYNYGHQYGNYYNGGYPSYTASPGGSDQHTNGHAK